MGIRAIAVIPESLLLRPQAFRLALWHELQHLRARDPQWMRALDLAARMAPWHPLLPLWIRFFRRGQEFACDEALHGRQSFDAHDYGQLLLMVARLTRAPAISPVRPAVAMLQDPGLTLTRRIEMLMEREQGNERSLGRKVGWSACVVATCALFAAAAASNMAIADSGVDLAEGQRLVAAATAATSGKGQIPLDMNEEVLKWLNHYLGTPGGRKWIRESLQRMRQYEAGIKAQLATARMPEDLLFVPLLESGFRNFTWEPGAGLWGFIPQTAITFGLRVDDPDPVTGRRPVDERLYVDKETAAAIAYLTQVQDEFQDWRLALKAYNQGEDAIRKQIARYGTSDPWELERRTPNPEHYLGKFTAIALIVKSPELFDRVD